MADKEVYQKRDVMMARMDANLQHLAEWSKSHTESDEKYQEKTDETLENLKKFQWKQAGAVGAIVAMVQFVSHFIK